MISSHHPNSSCGGGGEVLKLSSLQEGGACAAGGAAGNNGGAGDGAAGGAGATADVQLRGGRGEVLSLRPGGMVGRMRREKVNHSQVKEGTEGGSATAAVTAAITVDPTKVLLGFGGTRSLLQLRGQGDSSNGAGWFPPSSQEPAKKKTGPRSSARPRVERAEDGPRLDGGNAFGGDVMGSGGDVTITNERQFPGSGRNIPNNNSSSSRRCSRDGLKLLPSSTAPVGRSVDAEEGSKLEEGWDEKTSLMDDGVVVPVVLDVHPVGRDAVLIDGAVVPVVRDIISVSRAGHRTERAKKKAFSPLPREMAVVDGVLVPVVRDTAVFSTTAGREWKKLRALLILSCLLFPASLLRRIISFRNGRGVDPFPVAVIDAGGGGGVAANPFVVVVTVGGASASSPAAMMTCGALSEFSFFSANAMMVRRRSQGAERMGTCGALSEFSFFTAEAMVPAAAKAKVAEVPQDARTMVTCGAISEFSFFSAKAMMVPAASLAVAEVPQDAGMEARFDGGNSSSASRTCGATTTEKAPPPDATTASVAEVEAGRFVVVGGKNRSALTGRSSSLSLMMVSPPPDATTAAAEEDDAGREGVVGAGNWSAVLKCGAAIPEKDPGATTAAVAGDAGREVDAGGTCGALSEFSFFSAKAMMWVPAATKAPVVAEILLQRDADRELGAGDDPPEEELGAAVSLSFTVVGTAGPTHLGAMTATELALACLFWAGLLAVYGWFLLQIGAMLLREQAAKPKQQQPPPQPEQEFEPMVADGDDDDYNDEDAVALLMKRRSAALIQRAFRGWTAARADPPDLPLPGDAEDEEDIPPPPQPPPRRITRRRPTRRRAAAAVVAPTALRRSPRLAAAAAAAAAASAAQPRRSSRLAERGRVSYSKFF